MCAVLSRTLEVGHGKRFSSPSGSAFANTTLRMGEKMDGSTSERMCAPASAENAHLEVFAAGAGENPASPIMSRIPTILVAEDNQADVYLIRAALKEHGIGHVLRVAADEREVLHWIADRDSFRETQLELVILDLNLPRHDGLEILETLRATRRFAGVPVVVLTSSDSPADRTSARQLGAVRFLRKPSSLESFLALGAIFKDILQPGEMTPSQSGHGGPTL